MAKREGGENVRDRISRRLDLLPDLLGKEGLVEIRGRGSVTVRGGGKILLYTPEEIRISMPRCVLSISGEELVCTSYFQGAVGVDGRIGGVFFEEVGE
ncbi:MAG: YabP/YqfC family sporulation protein [Clostridia bacterium]|nr:YabP/YqfC family sporulation protein [Clostridia bacterium]